MEFRPINRSGRQFETGLPPFLWAKDLEPQYVIEQKQARTQLHSALRAKNWDEVNEILKQGHSKFHQLCSCINWDDVEGALFLLKGIPDVDFKNMEEITPLRFAVMKESTKFARLLIKKGADVDIQEFPNIVPIFAEVIRNFTVDYGLLKSHGTSVLQYAASFEDASDLKLMLKLGNSSINVQNKNGHAPLHGAYNGKIHCTWVRCEQAELLLRSGAKLDIKDARGRHPSFLVKCKEAEECQVVNHFKKLSVLGYKVESELLKSLLRNSKRKTPIYAENEVIRREYSEELEQLKKVPICWNYCAKTLYDLLFLKRTQLFRFAGNDVISRLYQEVNWDFEEKYPNFGFILNKVCNELEKMRNVTEVARDKLFEVTGSYILGSIADKLLSELSHCDLEVFCKIDVN